MMPADVAHSIFEMEQRSSQQSAACRSRPDMLALQDKYAQMARKINKACHDRDPIKFPHKRTGTEVSDKMKTNMKKYTKIKEDMAKHKLAMQVLV